MYVLYNRTSRLSPRTEHLTRAQRKGSVREQPGPGCPWSLGQQWALPAGPAPSPGGSAGGPEPQSRSAARNEVVVFAVMGVRDRVVCRMVYPRAFGQCLPAHGVPGNEAQKRLAKTSLDL